MRREQKDYLDHEKVELGDETLDLLAFAFVFQWEVNSVVLTPNVLA